LVTDPIGIWDKSCATFTKLGIETKHVRTYLSTTRGSLIVLRMPAKTVAMCRTIIFFITAPTWLFMGLIDA
jgi:hypothetical protein